MILKSCSSCQNRILSTVEIHDIVVKPIAFDILLIIVTHTVAVDYDSMHHRQRVQLLHKLCIFRITIFHRAIVIHDSFRFIDTTFVAGFDNKRLRSRFGGLCYPYSPLYNLAIFYDGLIRTIKYVKPNITVSIVLRNGESDCGFVIFFYDLQLYVSSRDDVIIGENIGVIMIRCEIRRC